MMELAYDHLNTSIGATTFVLLAAFVYRWLQPKPLRGFPHNPIASILGDIPEITRLTKNREKTLYDYYETLVDRHGTVTQMCIGNQSMLLLADPTEAERIIVQGKNVEMIKFVNIIYSRLMPTGQISLPTNDQWRRHRNILGPSMHQQYLSRMANHVATAANDLVNLWQTKQEIAKEKAFDAKIDLKLAMMDSIGRIALGSSLGCIQTALGSLSNHHAVEPEVIEFVATATVPIYGAFRTLFVHFGRAPLFPLLSVTFPLYTWLSPSWHASSRLVRSFMAQRVEERRREQDLREPLELATDADCILDMILQQEKLQGKKGLDENEILDELLLLFLGGHDSTSATLFWLVKYMALDAEIQRRLHGEVGDVFGHDLEDTSSIVLSVLEDSDRIPILEAVVAETLRCAMTTGAIGRYLTSDEVIMGRHVPKGTELVIPVSLMGMSEAAWGPDVKEWRPTRWLRADGSFNRNAGPGGNPFGLGHRACFGQRLGMMKLKIFAATLSRAFFFKPAPLKVSSPHAITMVTRQPKQCYVVLEEWDA